MMMRTSNNGNQNIRLKHREESEQDEIKRSSRTNDSQTLSELDDESYDSVFNWLDETLMNLSVPNDSGDLGFGESETKEPQKAYQKSQPQQPSLSSLEKKLLRLISSLEVSITDTSISVDKSIDEIERVVPRLSLDLQLMRENALLLRYSLESMSSKSSAGVLDRPVYDEETDQDSIDQNESGDKTDQILSRLKTLDLIKTRMESARTVLREAEAWSNLESEVTGYLTDPVPSHLKAAERLAEAAKSMVVFQHTAEYEARRSLMRSLQNELEASLSTSLVKALGEKDVKRCKEYFEIFKMIEREGEFKNYYFGSRRSSISTLWSQAKLSPPTPRSDKSSKKALGHDPGGSGDPTLLKFLASSFYPALKRLLQTELDFLPSIFNNPIETLTTFLTTTIDQLQPSISNRLVELVDYSYILAYWPNLIACWNVTEEFALDVQNLISQLDLSLSANTPLSPLSPIPDQSQNSSKLSRRTSLKRPISRKSGSQSGLDFLRVDESSTAKQATDQIPDPIAAWETSLFEPFIDLQCNYHEHEHNYLKASMVKTSNSVRALIIGRTDKKMTMTANNVLPEVVKSLLKLADESIDRCEAFTHGYGVLSCLEAIDLMLSEYIESSTETLRSEREEREREKYSSNNIQRSQSDQRSRGMQSYENEAAETGFLELEGLDYSSEDWEIFQQGLKLLGSCKRIHDRLVSYESQTTRRRMVEIVSRIKKNVDESVSMNDDLEFGRIKLSRGSKVLLKESNLNNTELWRFFDIISPPTATSLTMSASTPEKIINENSNNKRNSASESLNNQKPNQKSSITAQGGGMNNNNNKQKYLFYPRTNLSFTKLIRESQEIVQSIILLPLLNRLNDYPRLKTWNRLELESNQRKNSMMSNVELKILDQFSKSPTEIILKLGEGLFNLPRLFEVYTSVESGEGGGGGGGEGDCLSFSIETLPFIDRENLIENLKSFSQAQKSSKNGGGKNDEDEEDDDEEEGLKEINGSKFSSEMVISAWLSSLTSTIINQFVENVVPELIMKHNNNSNSNSNNSSSNSSSSSSSSSSRIIRSQLIVDIDYLINVVKALDCEFEKLENLKEKLESFG